MLLNRFFNQSNLVIELSKISKVRVNKKNNKKQPQKQSNKNETKLKIVICKSVRIVSCM